MERNSRLEFLAIPMTIVGIGIIAILVWAGNYGAGAWIVVTIVSLVALVAVIWWAVARPHRPPAPAPGARPEGAPAPPDDGIRRVLVIAGDARTSADLGAALALSGDGHGTQAFVVAPVLGSRTATFAGDEQHYRDASGNLEATLAALKELSVPADGHVGDSDPLQAVDDGLREFPAGEILFVVRASGESNWMEDGVVQEARMRYPIPVMELAPPSAA